MMPSVQVHLNGRLLFLLLFFSSFSLFLLGHFFGNLLPQQLSPLVLVDHPIPLHSSFLSPAFLAFGSSVADVAFGYGAPSGTSVSSSFHFLS
jgi:hypothetical protein